MVESDKEKQKGRYSMKAAIVYYSKHHGNTKKIVDAIASRFEVALIDAAENLPVDLKDFDCIGFASGIYFSSFAKQILSFAEKNLPENKGVFLIGTCGMKSPVVYFDAIRKVAQAKHCRELGAYLCLGFDTFGPFKVIGGIAQGHPDEKEIADAVKFYQEIVAPE